MSYVKKGTSLFLVMVMLLTSFAFAVPSVSAATSGTKNYSSSITVNTKAVYWYPGSSSITLKQSKLEYSYSKAFGKTDTKKGYAQWKITVTPTSKSGKSKVYWLDSSSETIPLDKNMTYRITVTYDSNGTFLNLNARQPNWKTTPSWRVSGTHKVSSYY